MRIRVSTRTQSTVRLVSAPVLFAAAAYTANHRRIINQRVTTPVPHQKERRTPVSARTRREEQVMAAVVSRQARVATVIVPRSVTAARHSPSATAASIRSASR